MPSPKGNNPPKTELKGIEFCDVADKKNQSNYFDAAQQATRKHRKTTQQNQKNNTQTN